MLSRIKKNDKVLQSKNKEEQLHLQLQLENKNKEDWLSVKKVWVHVKIHFVQNVFGHKKMDYIWMKTLSFNKNLDINNQLPIYQPYMKWFDRVKQFGNI